MSNKVPALHSSTLLLTLLFIFNGPVLVFSVGDMLDLAKVELKLLFVVKFVKALDVAVITAMTSGELQGWLDTNGFGSFAIAKVC